MNMMKINAWMKQLLLVMIAPLMFGAQSVYAEDQSALTNKIENLEFATLPGGKVNIKIKLHAPLANPPAGFALNNPARIALDFPKVANGMDKTSIPAVYGNLKSVTLAQAKDRTRMVLNLTKNVNYSTSMNANEVMVTLSVSNAVEVNHTVETKFAESKLGQQNFAIHNVDFARGKNGEGRIMVDLSDPTTGINIKQKGKTIVVDFINTDVPANLQRRLNVTNFNTPVVYVDMMKKGKNSQMVIEPKGNWEQSAYQADKKFIIDVRQVVEDPNKLVRSSKPGYAGEKLSLNFQNIEVRSVLQVIADFTGLNIVTSDTVGGNITLRLKDVPWDQALEIITKNKGLAMKKNGNVILIAPAEEVAAKEKQELEAKQQVNDLEQLRTESYVLKYTKADDLKVMLSDTKQKILSKRGTVGMDVRTNTLFVQDTPSDLERVQAIINKIDVPVRQVMIESRLVIADDNYSKQLGARFGVQQQARSGQTSSAIGGNIGNAPTAFTPAARDPDTGRPKLDAFDTYTLTGRKGTYTNSMVPDLNPATSPDGLPNLMTNLPVANAFGSIAYSIFHLPAGLLLNFELSAMESDGKGKIVSSPRVTTANRSKATIEAGTEIPYVEASSSGATTVAFKKAVLSLAVTPQITPDDNIIMDLDVRKEKVNPERVLGVPTIDTRKVQTQVQVGNGETAVLGGIFEQETSNSVEKVPFFGDIPVMGNLFKRKAKYDNKKELLIFVTPKIMDEQLNLQ